MEETVKHKTSSRVKERRQSQNQDGLPKRPNKHQGLIKNDLPQLSPPLSFDAGSPVKKLFTEASKIVKIGMEKEYALLERDTTLQNSNETIDNLRKNMLHLQMEYEKLDQNFQKEISYRADFVKRMDATRELVESVVQCSSVLAASIRQLEEDKLKIAEFYELIYQNQKEVEGKYEQTEKFFKGQEELLNAKFGEIKAFQEKILSNHSETVSQLNEKLTHAEDKLEVMARENEKLQKKCQECQDSSNNLQSCLQQQEKLNYLLQETVEQFKVNIRILKIQRFKYQRLLKNKKKQLSTSVRRNKNLKKSLAKADALYGECLSTNKILKSKNDEWRAEFEKHLKEDAKEREAWEAKKKELVNKLTSTETELEDLKSENKNLSEKISKMISSEGAVQVELEQVQNELSKKLNENLNLKETVAKLTEENSEKAKMISELEIKSASDGAEKVSQIEFYKNEAFRLEGATKKLEKQLLDLQKSLDLERTQNEGKISDFNYKFEENLKKLRERISNLEKLLEDKTACIQKLEAEKNHAELSGKTALENLTKELQAEKSKNKELKKNLQNVKEGREEVSKHLEEAKKLVSGHVEKLEELKSLNKTLHLTQIESEKSSAELKKELELGKKSFGDLEEKYKNAEKELNKLKKMAEENAELKTSTAEMKNHLETTEARLEAYKVVVKKLESEKLQAMNHQSEEMSRLKMELARLEEVIKKENRCSDASQMNFENQQSQREREMRNVRARDNSTESSQKLTTKENDPEGNGELEKWNKTCTPPAQNNKKFLSTPRKVLTSTPNFRSVTPLQKKRDPYEFDSDASVECFDPDKILKVCNRQRKDGTKRSRINK